MVFLAAIVVYRNLYQFIGISGLSWRFRISVIAVRDGVKVYFLIPGFGNTPVGNRRATSIKYVVQFTSGADDVVPFSKLASERAICRKFRKWRYISPERFK